MTTKPNEQATPRGGTYIAGYDRYPTGPAARHAGHRHGARRPTSATCSTGATTGPVDWSTFGGYDIAATHGRRLRRQRPDAAPSATPQAADQLAVATYNVENLDPSDPQTQVRPARRRASSPTSRRPDIVAVEEIQDNSGATDDGVVAADQTLTKLTAAIAAAGGPAYQWAADRPGQRPGRWPARRQHPVVFLYNPARVTFVRQARRRLRRPRSRCRTGADGTAELSASPGRVDPTNDGLDRRSRKPLAGEFVFHGKKVIVVANHFNSKGGDQSADGRFQPPNRSRRSSAPSRRPCSTAS